MRPLTFVPVWLALALVVVAPLAGPDGAGSVAAQIFPSSHASNLPTTTTLPRGDLLFEISPSFHPRRLRGE